MQSPNQTRMAGERIPATGSPEDATVRQQRRKKHRSRAQGLKETLRWTKAGRREDRNTSLFSCFIMFLCLLCFVFLYQAQKGSAATLGLGSIHLLMITGEHYFSSPLPLCFEVDSTALIFSPLLPSAFPSLLSLIPVPPHP